MADTAACWCSRGRRRRCCSSPRSRIATCVCASTRYLRGSDGDTLIEVKSTTGVKSEHIWDCAIQTWVARGSGRNVSKVELAHLDRDFVRALEGDYTGLLVREDITANVEALQPKIPAIVERLESVARGDASHHHRPAVR